MPPGSSSRAINFSSALHSKIHPAANPAKRIAVGKEEQGSVQMTFLTKNVGAKRTLLRRGAGDRTYPPGHKLLVRAGITKNGHPRWGTHFLVPVTGLEPVRCRQRWILSPLRLPIPSHRHIDFGIISYPLFNFKCYFYIFLLIFLLRG